MIRVKMCGVRTETDLQAVVGAGADAVGFIVGARHFTEDEVAPAAAADLMRSTPAFVSTVLVTHQTTAREIKALHEIAPTSTIQLHDDLPVAEVVELRSLVPFATLIKAIGVIGLGAIEGARRYAPHVDALLLDTHTNDRIGGTGEVHDWSLSRRIREEASKPVILAGGLTPENVEGAIASVEPYAVDVNSGVDDERGNKDAELAGAFVLASKHR